MTDYVTRTFAYYLQHTINTGNAKLWTVLQVCNSWTSRLERDYDPRAYLKPNSKHTAFSSY